VAVTEIPSALGALTGRCWRSVQEPYSMTPFLVLALATPVFGFALAAPPSLPSLGGLGFSPPAPVLASAQASAYGASLTLPGLSLQAASAADTAASAVPALSDEEYASRLRTRNTLAKIHRGLGISAWVGMIATMTFGFIQYRDLYGGPFGSHVDNPCVNGTAVFGYEGCVGRPWPHTISSLVTSAFYFSTFALSLFMPDPDDASEGDSEFARRIRTHKTLRWVHFGGMIAQIVLGLVTANAFDRSSPDDFRTGQLLAGIHMGIGLVTFGALTWAGALMLF
jgi:hypothetical protein